MRPASRLISVVLVGATSVALTACGSSKAASPPPAAPASSASPTPVSTGSVSSALSGCAGDPDCTARVSLRDAANAEETYFTDAGAYTTKVTQLLSNGLDATEAADVAVVAVHNPDSYCLTSKIVGTTRTWFYDSAHGGITTTACH